MNKYQRKRSKRIKKWMSILNAKGYNLTYKQTRRRMRRFDQTFNKWSPVWRYLHSTYGKELMRHWGFDKFYPDSSIVHHTYKIDETPIVLEPKLWPKDNPFVRQYLGTWHYKKEESE